VAYRLFAAEFDDADYSYSESDEERAPNYVVTPTGARVNRLFAVGVLTEVEQVNEDVLRARLADPTGAFVTYAGQYQPDAMAFLDDAEVPAFVALTGKARTFQPDDSDRVFTSVRPESVNAVDAATRDRWVVTAAEATLRRVAYVARAMDAPETGEALRVRLLEWGVPEGHAAGIPLALDHYGTTGGYLEGLRQVAVQALELVAGDREAVEASLGAPDDPGEGRLGPLPDVEMGSASTGQSDVGSAGVEADPDTDAEAAPAGGTDSGAGSVAAAGADTAGESTAASASPEPEPDDDDDDADPPVDEGATAGVGPGEREPEPAVGEPATEGEDATEADEPGDFLDEPGSFDDGGGADAEADAAGEGASTPEGDRYELDDDERESIESEYGTEFSTGGEVDDPGEADIEVPSAEEVAAELDEEPAGAAETSRAGDPAGQVDAPGEPDADAASADTGDAAGDTPDEFGEEAESDGDSSADADADAAADVDVDVDVEDAAVDVMADLDDGDGADREAVVAALVDRHGVTPEAAEEAIQSALMSGQCYEPSDGTLKAI
jgi:RPA family protein